MHALSFSLILPILSIPIIIKIPNTNGSVWHLIMWICGILMVFIWMKRMHKINSFRITQPSYFNILILLCFLQPAILNNVFDVVELKRLYLSISQFSYLRKKNGVYFFSVDIK